MGRLIDHQVEFAEFFQFRIFWTTNFDSREYSWNSGFFEFVIGIEVEVFSFRYF